MDRAAYERYLACFNARDYEGVLAHFADEFELAFAGHAFRTKDEVRRFYAFFHRYVDEKVTVHAYVSDGRMVAMEADVRLEGIEDMPEELLAEHGLQGLVTLRKGQVITMRQFIHYHLKDGKIVRALCAVFQPAR